jgi:hypothetical protein
LGRFSEIAAKVTQDPAPKEVAKRIDRGTTAMERYLPTWVEALAFFDNDQYVERSAVHPTGVDRLETREGGTKARYQLRNVFNRYTPKLLEECAMLASRTPGFECVPMNGDPSAQHGARLGEKALLGAYELLELDTEMLDLLIHAANCGAAWLWPYWNPGMGAVLDYKDGKEVRARLLAAATGRAAVGAIGQLRRQPLALYPQGAAGRLRHVAVGLPRAEAAQARRRQLADRAARTRRRRGPRVRVPLPREALGGAPARALADARERPADRRSARLAVPGPQRPGAGRDPPPVVDPPAAPAPRHGRWRADGRPAAFL